MPRKPKLTRAEKLLHDIARATMYPKDCLDMIEAALVAAENSALERAARMMNKMGYPFRANDIRSLKRKPPCKKP